MNYCMNRDQKVYYIPKPVFDKKEMLVIKDDYMKCMNIGEFMACGPKFSDDYSKLIYVGAEDKFISHTGNYQLRSLRWPPRDEDESFLVVDKFQDYPKQKDEFCGIYGA